MGFFDSGISEGLNQTTGHMVNMGMQVARFKQDQLVQDQTMRLRQEAAERERIAFARQEAAIKEKEARDNTVVPASKYWPKIRQFPSFRQSLKEGFEALNLPYEETPDGDILGKYGHGQEVLKWIYNADERAEKQAKGVYADLQTQKMVIIEQLKTAKKPEEVKTLNDQLEALSLQQGQVLGSSWEVQKKIAEAQAKPQAEGAPHTITKTSPDGKTEQTFQYNPNSMAVDKYDIPIGQPHPVKSQVIGIVEQNKQSVGFNTWKPEAKAQEFMEHVITGQPPVNVRGLAGADRQSYAKEFAQWKVDRGLKPQDVALIKADYKAGDMSLKNMTKQEAPMSAFVLNINRQISKVEELYKSGDRTGLRLIDLPIRELRVKAKGSGDEAVKASYLLEISNEIGKLSSGASGSVQQLSDSAKEDWKKVHDVNLSMKEIMKVVNATRDQANMRISTWREAKEEVRKSIQFIGTENSNYQPFDVALPAGVKAEDIAAELARRRKK